MNYPVLRAELLTDPVTLGYSGLTDANAAAKLNATDTLRTQARTAVRASEILGAIDDGAWPATVILQDKLARILSIDPIDASNTNIRGILGVIFPNAGATAATRARLLALGTQTVSRATELGLGAVATVDVTLARSGSW